ncbi:transposase [Chryseobacterium defluvii]|uniref:Uncharacterized protein n=1 Tax=Chryseobacterium defluvii TaxID=160396 RepID=A0A495SMF2_9FLAO|nr:transposase [Chryseobacterium defluvii]RKT01489.1 hypothetical protein BCF58_0710 [Chryseobacterium defluvii]
MRFKDIHIGLLIQQRCIECEIDLVRICNFFKCSAKDIEQVYQAKSLDTDTLLKWSKLLEYDFFRLYSQHLILFAPPSSNNNSASRLHKTSLPQFRKKIYTKEVIEFMLELIETGEKTKLQIIDDYKIPKTTLYKWIDKYQK